MLTDLGGDIMNPTLETNRLFFDETELTNEQARQRLSEGIAGADDGELFLERRTTESLVFDDGRLRSANHDISQGFGMRAVAEEFVAYAHGGELSDAALAKAAETAREAGKGREGSKNFGPALVNHTLYGHSDPTVQPKFAVKVGILEQIDAYLRAKDPAVVQVSASITAELQAIKILRANGDEVSDVRPLVRVNVQVTVRKGERMEIGSDGRGGRLPLAEFLEDNSWRASADEALRQALIKLDAIPAPAGEMTVVLGPGWPGVMLHEAVGHGLEGDFNRKGSSAFSGLMGEMVAAKGVTVVDDGTIEARRGSLNFDDEGTPTQRNVLIEDGRLVGYMQDRMNARLMGVHPTGNGRRQSYAHQPMPRMTNTFMVGGNLDPEDIIASVDRGVYAVNFGGGQVDITSGKYVFSASEAYMIEGGKVTAPIKGATLIGDGPESMKRVSMIGNDMALDAGIGVCGKSGQGVPVGVGQPTLKMDGVTIGGTAA
jgi:TldD protein